MIVFDLRCASSGHVFESWFGSSADYEDQRARRLIACPLCGDADVSKAVMAPNVAPKGNRGGTEIRQLATPAPEQMKAALEALARAQAAALKDSHWVGKDFANEARAMHLGETEQRTIHGEATAEQARALVDEGVEVAPLPFPVVPPAARN
ncbi:DUF1178 family protein [Sphingomonas sp. LaA6.9]|uniref:DUF1178 family protein n=1 Tax=Sphingomonas sp. LaA6.9 TaxID=2919914 RepID=UPI001F4FD535|nr:DUF1178 family protein [Sphingomonas sp. LaA6.9]MCJ8157612.1 DUF1178 family protein [Sphingomonas sp. LaA6.9]